MNDEQNERFRKTALASLRKPFPVKNPKTNRERVTLDSKNSNYKLADSKNFKVLYSKKNTNTLLWGYLVYYVGDSCICFSSLIT